MNDIHAPYIAELTGRDDWSGLIRYWIAHGLHRPALDAALTIVRRRPDAPWPTLAAYLGQIAEAPMEPREPPEALRQLQIGRRQGLAAVAADLVGMGVQNLRLYEARGLLEPERTDGGTRRYSANDLDRLRRIGDLLHAGLNLAGIGMVLELEGENAQLRQGLAAPAWPATMGTSSAPRSRKPTSSNKNSSKPIPR